MTLQRQWALGYRWGWVLLEGALLHRYVELGRGEDVAACFTLLVVFLVLAFREGDAERAS